ncbi:MAG: hypothetical protein ACI4EP_00840 [Suilimivivens sp.]|nr:hypothetical protein [Lachnospiraceae bacterium]
MSIMLENAEKIFDGMQEMMKKLKKSSYEKNMKMFREKNEHFFGEMTSYVEQAEEPEQAAKEIAVSFVDCVENHFSKKGKIGGRTQADLNFFMIYYTFPAILLTESEHAKKIADALCSEWGNRFKDSKIGYADYGKIYGAFREKIFGLF